MSNTSSFWFAGEDAPTPDGPTIGQSLRFRGESRLVSVNDRPAGDFTISFWVKWGNKVINGSMTMMSFTGNQCYQWRLPESSQSGEFVSRLGGSIPRLSNGTLRDFSSWYHIVLQNDAGTTTMYLNGERQQSATTPTGGMSMTIGSNLNSSQDDRFCGYLAEYYLLDGQILGPEAFGELDESGVWVPREVSFAYGATTYSDFLYTDVSNTGATASPNLSSTTKNNISPSGPATNAFDGDTATRCYTDGVVGSWLVWRPPLGSYTDVTKVRVYVEKNNTEQIWLNGTKTSFTGDGSGTAEWIDLGVSGTLDNIQNIAVQGRPAASAGATLFAIEINDVIVTDPNTWSQQLYSFTGSQAILDSGVTSTELDSTEKNFPAASAAHYGFDGNPDAYAYSALGDGWVFRPTTPIQGVTKIEIKNGIGEKLWYNGILSDNIGSDTRQTFYDGPPITLETLAGLYGPTYNPSSSSGFGELLINGALYIDGENPSYGPKGFHLDFADPNDIGRDVSGNGNDMDPIGFDTTAYRTAYWVDNVYTATSGEVPNSEGSPYIVDVLPADASLDYTNSQTIQSLFDGDPSTYIYWVADEYPTGNVMDLKFDLRDYSDISKIELLYAGGGSSSTDNSYTVELLDASKTLIAGTNMKLPAGVDFASPEWADIPVSGNPRYLRFFTTPTAADTWKRAYLFSIRINGQILSQSLETADTYDLMQDSPTQNFNTFNPLAGPATGLINANLTSQSQTNEATSTIDVVDRVYGEFQVNQAGGSGYPGIGIWKPRMGAGITMDAYEFLNYNGWIYYGSSTAPSRDFPTFTTGDMVTFAWDRQENKLWYNVNGPIDITAAGTSIPTAWPENEPATVAVIVAASNTSNVSANYGQQPFRYTPPAGFEPLTTQNLPVPAIPNGGEYFRAITGPGTGPSIDPATQIPVNSYTNPSGFLDNNDGIDYRPYQGFNGDNGGTYFFVPNNTDGGVTPSIVFDEPMTGTTFEIYCSVGQGSFFVNGIEVVGNVSPAGFVDISTQAAGSLKSFGFSSAGASADGFSSLRIDGKQVIEGGILTRAQQIFPYGLYWVKSRVSDTAENYHQFADTNRGVDRVLWCPNQANEGGYSQPSGESVAWCWAVDGPPEDNTDGDLTAAVATSATGGFSIINYTGNGVDNTKIGHGLGAKPDFILLRNRTNGSPYWSVFNSGTYSGPSAPQVQYLDQNASASNDTNVFGTAAEQTDTYFTVGTYEGTNESASSIQAYAWRAIPGYSAFGKYDTNGSAEGPFVYLGFRPAWLMLKNIGIGGSGYSWFIYDTTRNPDNPVGYTLSSDTFAPEATNINLDIVSNGFKIRDSAGAINSNMIQYAAFAENPFNISNAR